MIKYRDVVLESNKVTKTKRIYPKELLEKNVASLQEVIKGRGLFGQMDFPSDSLIHISDASHIITELVMEVDNMVAEIEPLNTPYGKVLSQLIKDGCKIVLRPYGVGTGEVNENNELVINDNYKLISISVLADPAGSD